MVSHLRLHTVGAVLADAVVDERARDVGLRPPAHQEQSARQRRRVPPTLLHAVQDHAGRACGAGLGQREEVLRPFGSRRELAESCRPELGKQVHGAVHRPNQLVGHASADCFDLTRIG